MNNRARWAAVYGVLGLASLLFMGIGYAALHKPFSAQDLIGVASAGWQLVLAGLIVAAAGGLGERLLGELPVQGPTRAGLAFAIGTLIMSSAILILGVLFGTGPLAFVISGLALLALLRREIPRWARDLAAVRGAVSGRFESLVALCAAAIVLAAVVNALAPPTEFDTLVYHFALPRAYLQHGRIEYLPELMFWGMPQIGEMLDLAAMRLAGEGAAAVVGVLSGLVTLIGVVDFAGSRFGRIAGWAAVAALLAGESLTRALWSGYVEWTAMLFGWAALVALEAWSQNHDRRWLILGGLCCGGAVGTKYTAGVLLIGCAVVVALSRRPIKDSLFGVFVLGLTALAASLPWWTKNWLATGNPFYPLLISSGAMDALRLDFYQHVDVWRDWRAVALLPWQAALQGAEGKDGFGASIGPLLAGLSPLAWFGWRSRSQEQRRLLIFTAMILACGLTVWAAASRVSGLLIQSRLYFVVFPAWSILAGAGLGAIWDLKQGTVRFGRLAAALTLLMLGLSVLAAGRDLIQRDPLGYVLGIEDRDGYLERQLGPFAGAMQAIQSLPAGSRVLMLWEARGYYCLPRCDSDEIIDRWFHDSHLHPNSAALIQSWRAQGYTHLLIFDLGAEFVRTRDPAGRRMDWDLLEATLAELTLDRRIAGAYTLYRIP